MDPPTPAGYPVRAIVGEETVAVSTGAVRVDRVDAAPQLWFPRADVSAAALNRADGHWVQGTGDLTDYVTADPEQVLLEIVDSVDDDAERDVTTKRFPNWGDAAHLIEIIDVQPQGDNRYRCDPVRVDWRRPVVEGSQILGQTIVAACATHTPGRRVVAASMVFVRGAGSTSTYSIELDPVTEGRTFTSLRVTAAQDDRICAFGTVLLDTAAPDVIRHTDPAPDVAGPYDSTPYDMGVTGATSASSTMPTRATPTRPWDRRSSTRGSASATFPTTSRSMPASSPSSPGTCPSRPRCDPTPASARTKPTARCPRPSTRSLSRSTATSAPTDGCSTTTARPSPATA